MKYLPDLQSFVFEANTKRLPSFSDVTVHKLSNRLIKELLPAAVCKHSLIINNIHPALTVHTDENMLAYVLWNMLEGAVRSTEEKCIYIDVELHDKGIIILVKDAGDSFYKNISPEYRRVQFVAEKLGGNMHVDQTKNNRTTVALALFRQSEAA